MDKQLLLEYSGRLKKENSVEIPLSKSISNRVLILNAISKGGISANEYGNSSDTEILQNCIRNLESKQVNAEDAGTSFRFLTALAALGSHEVTINGSQRMKERPITGLVNALEDLGARIDFVDKNGFAPIKIKPPLARLRSRSAIKISDTSSSQFISALMLIAPKIKDGLQLIFPINMPSQSYIFMTAEILKQAGVNCEIDENQISIPEQNLTDKDVKIEIEKDWSSASYFFTILSIGNWESILLKDLKLNSIQSDNRINDFFKPLGIKSNQLDNGVLITKEKPKRKGRLIFDFKDNPDLCMTVVLAYALNKIDIKVKGIENLIYKESNRIEALKTELDKINVKFYREGNFWQLETSGLKIPKKLSIKTYNDHRIAMAFSVLALNTSLTIDNPDVVKKSFPNYWEQLEILGFELKLL